MGILELMGVLAQQEREWTVVPGSTIHNPHREDEAHGSEHTDWRKSLHGVEPVALQYTECRSIWQCQCRHIESHAEGINGNKHCLIRSLTSLTHTEQTYHGCSCQKVTIAQKTLRLDILICHNTHQCRHKNRYDSLYGIEPGNLGTHPSLAEIVAHRRKISSPNCKLQEVHHC